MRKVIMYCDRCKKEFEKWNHKKTELYGVAEFVHDDSDPYLDEPKDLCESCYTELENWWHLAPKVERPKGKWIEVDPLGTGDKAYMCSECETGDWDVTIGEYKFCPYCGAEMEGVEE